MTVLILLVLRDHQRDAVPWHELPGNERGLDKTWVDLKHVFTMSQFWILTVRDQVSVFRFQMLFVFSLTPNTCWSEAVAGKPET